MCCNNYVIFVTTKLKHMKTKIKEALKTKFVSFGLGDKAFDGVASLLAKTATPETDIETLIKDPEIEELLKGFQSDTDKIRQENADLKRKLGENLAPIPPVPPVPPPPPPVDILAQMKELLNPITEKLSRFEQKEQRDLLFAQAQAKRDLLRIDPKQSAWVTDAWNHATGSLSDQDTADTIVDRFKTRFDEFMSRQGVSGYVPAIVKPGENPKSHVMDLIDKVKEKQSSVSDVKSISDRLGLSTQEK